MFRVDRVVRWREVQGKDQGMLPAGKESGGGGGKGEQGKVDVLGFRLYGNGAFAF